MPTLSRQIDNSPRVEELIRQALTNVAQGIRQNMSGKRRNASGSSVGSLRIETNGVSGTLYGSRSFAYMEYGRGAGKIPYDFVGILTEWIKKKGLTINSGQTERQVAGAIAYSIRQKGTTLHQRRGFDDIFSSLIPREVDSLGVEILRTVSSSIQYINEQYAKND